ncbi:hypothetical protein BJV82DRAFT_582896 [Fennellomyces sp. T-0311]|nr:hypothetical protein BJV82DRAFT_582896 [Fennellomyces sp. T-0311]
MSREPTPRKPLELDDVEFTSNGNSASNESALSAVFFQRFTRNSNLEVVYAMRIKPELGLEALKTLAMIQTVKKLDIDLGSTVSSGDLLEFIRLLRETRIENLNLQQVRNVSFDILDALATLSLLKTVYADWSGGNEYMYIDKEGLRRMLNTSQSLLSIKFYNTVLTDNDKYLRLHEVKALIEEANWKGTTNSTSGHWKVLYFGEHEDPMVLEEICIERVSF